MAERVGIRSRACRNCSRSYRGGQPPRKLPTRGTHPPRSPCSNPTIGTFILSHTLAPYVSRFTSCMWRRGWDSNPRSHCWDACFPSMSIRPLSHLSTPIFARRHLSMWSDDQQVDCQRSSPMALTFPPPLPILKELMGKYGDEDSHRAEYPRRPLGDSHHILPSTSLHIRALPESFTASL